MAKHKHHGGHEEEVSEAWLLPYADLLTLLLAVFIILYASSTIDIAKFNSVMSGLYEAVHGTPPVVDDTTTGTNQDSSTVGQNAGIISAPPVEVTEDRDSMNEIAKAVKDYIDENDLGSVMSLGEESDGFLITLKSDVWFDSGSAAVTDQMMTTARSLSSLIVKADALATQNYNEENAKLNGPNEPKETHVLDVIVQGHTDNLPISNAQFSSNWHLSVARSLNFMIILMGNPQLDPTRFSARGYGEYQPIDTNDTEEGRRKNRRVEIFIPTPKVPKALHPSNAPESQPGIMASPVPGIMDSQPPAPSPSQ